MEHFVNMSLELNLFFARIMKEHSLFLEAGFMRKDTEEIRKANWFRMQFEDVLLETVRISNGTIRASVLESEEIVTPFTLGAEKKTQFLTGIPINSCITVSERQFRRGCICCCTNEMIRRTRILNERALQLVTGLIRFKETILNEVLECRMFTANYPLLIKHIIREAKLYQTFLRELVEKETICVPTMRQTELFWNQIMMEHALFIRGLLDPTENELIETADDFAEDYAKLLTDAGTKNCMTMEALTEKTIETTIAYKQFKTAGTEGITNCNIESIILPLLADHVLREANHYLRLLKE